MRIPHSLLILAALSAAPGCVCNAQPAAVAKGFGNYPVVQTRNIFDPRREALHTPAETVARPVEPPRKASDYVSLTGIMFSGGKALAFFYGSRPDYDKVLGVNADIAGGKLTKILPSGIEVDRGGKKIVVAVGQTVPFDDSAPGPAPAPAGDSALASPPAASAAPGGAAPPLPGNLSNVMRQMMARRQKELQ